MGFTHERIGLETRRSAPPVADIFVEDYGYAIAFGHGPVYLFEDDRCMEVTRWGLFLMRGVHRFPFFSLLQSSNVVLPAPLLASPFTGAGLILFEEGFRTHQPDRQEAHSTYIL